MIQFEFEMISFKKNCKESKIGQKTEYLVITKQSSQHNLYTNVEYEKTTD